MKKYISYHNMVQVQQYFTVQAKDAHNNLHIIIIIIMINCTSFCTLIQTLTPSIGCNHIQYRLSAHTV